MSVLVCVCVLESESERESDLCCLAEEGKEERGGERREESGSKRYIVCGGK